MDTEHTRITGGKLDIVDREIVMILEPTGEVVPLDRWREQSEAHRDCCDACRYSHWWKAAL